MASQSWCYLLEWAQNKAERKHTQASAQAHTHSCKYEKTCILATNIEDITKKKHMAFYIRIHHRNLILKMTESEFP